MSVHLTPPRPHDNDHTSDLMFNLVSVQDLIIDGLRSSAFQIGQSPNFDVCGFVSDANIDPNRSIPEQMHPHHVHVVFFYVQT